jgi:hypothetical protein
MEDYFNRIQCDIWLGTDWMRAFFDKRYGCSLGRQGLPCFACMGRSGRCVFGKHCLNGNHNQASEAFKEMCATITQSHYKHTKSASVMQTSDNDLVELCDSDDDDERRWLHCLSLPTVQSPEEPVMRPSIVEESPSEPFTPYKQFRQKYGLPKFDLTINVEKYGMEHTLEVLEQFHCPSIVMRYSTLFSMDLVPITRTSLSCGNERCHAESLVGYISTHIKYKPIIPHAMLVCDRCGKQSRINIYKCTKL